MERSAVSAYIDCRVIEHRAKLGQREFSEIEHALTFGRRETRARVGNHPGRGIAFRRAGCHDDVAARIACGKTRRYGHERVDRPSPEWIARAHMNDGNPVAGSDPGVGEALRN